MNRLNKINIIYVIIPIFVLQMLVISKPEYEVVDEHFFTNFARWMIMGIDHSPYQLSGLSIIAYPFFEIFGDNYFSWRFPIIIFGMVFLYFNYKVFRKISNHRLALITTVIICLSPTIFHHSGLMLRDIPIISLGFMSLYFYLNKKYYHSFFIVGLAGLIKETAIMFVIFMSIHYVIVNRERLFLNILSSKIKTCVISFLIMACAFLIPLAIYDNMVTVYEYDTRHRELIFINEDGKPQAEYFNYFEKPSHIMTYAIEFNYVDIVKDPIHHMSLIFTKGYYDDSMMVAEIPPEYEYSISKSIIPYQRFNSLSASDEEVIRVQSMNEFHWWYVAFWGSIALITYSTINTVRDKIKFNKKSLFILIGLFTFFIPYLLVDFIRPTFAYYILYYAPFMAFALTLLIERSGKIKYILYPVLFSIMTYMFVYVFPIKII